MGLKEWLFNPYEEPEESEYVSNEHGIDEFTVLLSAFPVAGLGPILMSCLERYTGNPAVNNDSNIDNVAWNSVVVGTAIQALTLLTLAVAFAAV